MHEEAIPKSTQWIIAVHVGAGYHAPDKTEAYKNACHQACLAAREVLTIMNGSHQALEAAVAATRSLENDAITNAGLGSVLTEEGTIECDAAVMDGQDGRFAAVGAVSGVKNPIDLAARLLYEDRSEHLSFGRVRPM
jgi:taspase, threonine aspartase, 1